MPGEGGQATVEFASSAYVLTWISNEVRRPPTELASPACLGFSGAAFARERERLQLDLILAPVPAKRKPASEPAQIVSTIWVDSDCGDGTCQTPFEFPAFGRCAAPARPSSSRKAALLPPSAVKIRPSAQPPSPPARALPGNPPGHA